MKTARAVGRRSSGAPTADPGRGEVLLTRTSTGGDMVQWVDADGQTCTATASGDLLRQPLHEARPIRAGSQYANRQNRHGWYAWTGSKRHVWFESAVEMDSLVALDQRGDVAAIAAQPFRVLFRSESSRVSHVPDYFAVLEDGSQVLFDVKPLSRMTPSAEEQFVETARICDFVGWRHEVLHEPCGPRRANLALLREFRHRRCHPFDPGQAANPHNGVPIERVLDIFAGGRSIGDGRRMLSLRDPSLAMPTIAHLLWHRFLDMDWETPLTLDTVVTVTRRAAPCCTPT